MTQKYTSLEHSIRNIVEGKEVSKPNISDAQKKHNKLAQIKTKIIDEEQTTEEVIEAEVVDEGAKDVAIAAAKFTGKVLGKAAKWGAIGAGATAAYNYATDDANRKDLYPDQDRKPDPVINEPNEPGPDLRVGGGKIKPTLPKTAKGPAPRDYGAYVDTTKRKKISEETAAKVKDAVQKKKAEKTKGANPQVVFEPELKTAVDESALSVAAGVGKTAAKKALPGIGTALSAYDAYQRVKKGDYVGAALSGAAGVASLVPGVGTGASIGLTGVQMARDYQKKTGLFEPSEKKPAAQPKAEPPKAQTPNDKPVDEPKTEPTVTVDRTAKGDKKKKAVAESVMLTAFKQKYPKNK